MHNFILIYIECALCITVNRIKINLNQLSAHFDESIYLDLTSK